MRSLEVRRRLAALARVLAACAASAAALAPAAPGPRRAFRYQTTLDNPFSFPNMHVRASLTRTTWTLTLDPYWATLRRVRQSGHDPRDRLDGRFERATWTVVDEARYEGRCVGAGGASCLDATTMWLDLPRVGDPGAPALAWQCAPAVVAALGAEAVLDGGDCQFRAASWRPDRTRVVDVLRCDGVGVAEPSDDSFADANLYRTDGVPRGLMFAAGAGLEWAFVDWDCPLPGTFRRLP